MKCEGFLCVVWVLCQVYHLIHQTKSTCLIIMFRSRVHDIHLFMIHQHPFMSGGIRRRIFQNVPTHPSKVKECRVFLALTLRPDIPYLAFNFKWMIFIKLFCIYIYIYIITLSIMGARIHSPGRHREPERRPIHAIQLHCSIFSSILDSNCAASGGLLWTSTGHLVTCWNWNRPPCFCLQYLKWENGNQEQKTSWWYCFLLLMLFVSHWLLLGFVNS